MTKQYTITICTKILRARSELTKKETYRLSENGGLWENIANYNEAERAMKKAFKRGGHITVSFGIWDSENMEFLIFHSETYLYQDVDGMSLMQIFDVTEQNA